MLLRPPVPRGSGFMKEIEAQIEDLRGSPHARRALEARVWHHLSKRSRRYGHRGGGRGRRRPRDDPSVCSNDSAGSVGSDGSIEARGVEGRTDDCSSGKDRSLSPNIGPAYGGVGSTSRKAVEHTSVSERVAAQTLHAQQVLRRRRCV